MLYINTGSCNEIKMVILDLAGTTVDYGSCAPAAALKELFAWHGISLYLEKARGPMGMHKRDHIKALATDEKVANQWHQVYGRPFNNKDLEQLYQEFIPLQLNILEKHGLLIPGTLEAQHYFRAKGIKIGVTTGYCREISEIVLKQMEKQGFEPDVMVCSSDVAGGRPAPWMAITAAQKLGIDTPEAVVKIGDTEVDIAAGLNAGMWSVGVVKTGNMLGLTLEEQWTLPEWELHSRLEEARMKMANTGAHEVIDSIADAPFTVEKINVRLANRKKSKSSLSTATPYWVSLKYILRQKTGQLHAGATV
jgi:phosphonoacetaldehyde hydrolase